MITSREQFRTHSARANVTNVIKGQFTARTRVFEFKIWSVCATVYGDSEKASAKKEVLKVLRLRACNQHKLSPYGRFGSFVFFT